MKYAIPTLLFLALFAPLLYAINPPGILNHQGRIAVNGTNYTGPGYFKFALIDSLDTETYWSNENHQNPSHGIPGTAVSVSITDADVPRSGCALRFCRHLEGSSK